MQILEKLQITSKVKHTYVCAHTYTHTHTPSRIIENLLKLRTKENIKKSQGKTFSKEAMKIYSWCLNRNNEIKKTRSDIFEVLKEKNSQTIILYPQKIFLKSEREIDITIHTKTERICCQQTGINKKEILFFLIYLILKSTYEISCIYCIQHDVFKYIYIVAWLNLAD